MRGSRAAIVAATVIAALGAGRAAAIELALDRRAIEQALDIAHSTIQSTHFRFHADYRFTVAKPPVDFVEVVSPFRRLVLEAAASLRQGRRMFGQREALASLQPDPERVEIYVELTFHPMNTFVSVPPYDVELVPLAQPAARVRPGTIDRIPRLGPRLEDSNYPFTAPYAITPRTPVGSEPLLGGTLIARFQGHLLDPKGVYEAVVKDGEQELGRTWRIDLSRLR
jgi:hypothetical protein